MASLDYVAFHLTYVCGNKCSFCYVGNNNRAAHPSQSVVLKVVKRLSLGKVKEILLVGGDPCSYPNLKGVVCEIQKLGLKCNLLSNTLEFGSSLSFFAKRLSSIGCTFLGASEKEHDAVTKTKGSFALLIKNMRLLNQAGAKVEVWVTLTKDNHSKLAKLAKRLIEKEKLDLACIGIQRVIPQGRASGSLENSLTKKEVAFVFKQLDKIHKKYNLPIDFEDPFPLCVIEEKYRYLQKHGCEWGVRKASVNFEGKIGRCGADSRFSLGNIFNITNLQDFWQKSEGLCKFRSANWLPTKCQKCALIENCRCGCPLSRVTTTDFEKDILCSFR